ncbi:hypothetical protein KQX54_013654 [Cotesia glomerata]|uniref:Endonuclease/exonuclease/phosphatase domain-containing protein n=1 Tax=Cotesia glomerata TaxID=32391 RepID=A0AAV7I374_COTGL|nr:hypothetical protein KQX54_013654 [Cotesia glomerata]
MSGKKNINAPIYINNDLTREEQLIANKLRDASKELKKEGKKVKLQHQSITVDGKHYKYDLAKQLLVPVQGNDAYPMHIDPASFNSSFIEVSETWCMNPITSHALSPWQLFWSPATKQQQGLGRPSGGLLSLAAASVNTTILTVPRLTSYTTKEAKTVLEFFEANGFTLPNGRAPSDTPGHFTFSNKNGHSLVDLTWVNNDSLHLVKDMWVDELVSKSDHFPIAIEIYSKYNINTDASNSAQGTSKTTHYKPCWRDKKKNYKHQMAWSPLITCDFARSHTDILCDNLYSAILDAASEILNFHRKRPN